MDDELLTETDPQAPATDIEQPDDREIELERFRVALESREAELAAAREANRAVLDGLRAAMMTIEPAITPEMLAGDTLDELEASFNTAVETLARIRESVRREQALPIGAGAPGRHNAAPLTALEKIREGLART